MSIGNLLHRSLEIRRSLPVSPAQDDEYGNPVYAAEAVIATVAGRIETLTVVEQVLTSDMGPVAVNARGYVLITDVTEADRVRDVAANQYFEVRGVRDAGGASSHLELDLWRVHE